MLSAIGESLRSVRLTIALFLLLAGGAVLGTLIPQNLSLPEYQQIYGPFVSRFLLVLDVTDLYHSVWFVGLIVTLALNLIACSIRRFPSAWKALGTPQRPLTDQLWETVPIRRTLQSDEDPHNVVQWIRKTLGRGRWKVRQENVGADIHLTAQKGRYSRMGVFVAHLGVVVILSGGLLGILWGFNGSIQVPQGKTVARVQDRHHGTWRDLGFQVRCDAFLMSTYADGTPKEYRSDLSFLEDGEVTTKGIVRVNHPFKFGGFVFYQSSYGYSASVTLEAMASSGGPIRRIQLEVGDMASMSLDGKTRIRPMRYEPNFQGMGPAVLLAILRQGSHPIGGWFRKGEPPAPIDGWNLRFLEAEAQPWTGLQVRKDPGVWVVWVGCTLILIGCTMAFFMPNRRIWIRVRRQRGKALCHMAASSPKGRQGLEEKVNRLCHVWQRQAGLHLLEGGKEDE